MNPDVLTAVPVVRVHRNLRHGGFSVLDHTPGSPTRRRVIGRVERFALENVTFIVSDSGRERVRRHGCRGVHAWAQGTPTLFTKPDENWLRVTYNPFTDLGFHSGDGRRVLSAQKAVFMNGAVWVSSPDREP